LGCGFDIHEMLGTKMRVLFLDLTPSIYMNRVAGQIGKIATRTVQVVAGTTMPSRTDTRASDLAATASLITSKICSVGRGLAGELPRCVSCQGE
jgi:hypothetical protein